MKIYLHTVSDVARKFEVSRRTVYDWINKSLSDPDWPHQKTPEPFRVVEAGKFTFFYWTPDQLNNEWVSWYEAYCPQKPWKNGYETVSDVARKFEVSRRAVSRWINKSLFDPDWPHQKTPEPFRVVQAGKFTFFYWTPDQLNNEWVSWHEAYCSRKRSWKNGRKVNKKIEPDDPQHGTHEKE